MTDGEHESGGAGEPDGGSPWRREHADRASGIEAVQNSAAHPVEDGGRPPVGADDRRGVANEVQDEERRRRRMAIGATAGAVALGVGAMSVLFLSGSPPEDADDSVPSTQAVVETLPTVPSATDRVESDETPDPDATIDVAPDGDPDEVTALVPLRVDLPSVLADQTEPTEILALTVDGQLITVSIPSGNVRVEALDFSDNWDPQFLSFNAGLVTSPSAVAVQTAVDRVTITGRDGRVRFITAGELGLEAAEPGDVFPVGWVSDAAGTEHFVLSVAPVSGDRSMVLVDLAGNISPLDAGNDTERGGGVVGAQFANGAGYFDEGGLVFSFRAGEDIRTIGRGELMAVLDSGPVVRRCTSATDCVVEIMGADGAEPIVPSVLDVVLESFVAPSIAPDGSAMATARFDDDGVALFLTPLQSDIRSSRRVAIGNFPRSSFGWVADSSGVVNAMATDDGGGVAPSEPGIRFVSMDPATDEITFATEIGQVVAIATRFPAEELPPQTLTETRQFDVTDAQRRLPTVIAADRQGTVSRIDFANGRVTDFRTGLRPLWSNGRPAQVVPMEQSVVVIDDDGVDGVEIIADQTAAPPSWPAGRHYPFDGRSVWAPVEVTEGGIDYLLVDRSGQPVDDVVDVIPAESVLGSNGAGTLVREVAGDVFTTNGDGSVRLTTGDVIALGIDEAIVHECGIDLSCEFVRVDLGTGERRTVEAPTLDRPMVGATTGREVALEGSLSPDGRTALVEMSATDDIRPGWAFADLVDDDLVPIDTPDTHQPIVWSADSISALFLSDGELHVFDRDLGTTDIVTDFRLLLALGIDSGASPD